MIVDALCTEANKIFNADCFEKNRLRNNVDCRTAMTVILKDHRFYTYQKIAKLFESSHCKSIYYYKRHQQLMKFTHDYRNKYLSLLALVEPYVLTKEFYCPPYPFMIKRHV